MGLRERVWVKAIMRSSKSLAGCGFSQFDYTAETDMILRWLLYPNRNVCSMHTRSPVSDRRFRCVAYSVIRRRASSPLCGAQKTVCKECSRTQDGTAAHCRPENKVSLGFVAGLNNKICVIQRRAYGLRDEEYLRLKILTSMLPNI